MPAPELWWAISNGAKLDRRIDQQRSEQEMLILHNMQALLRSELQSLGVGLDERL